MVSFYFPDEIKVPTVDITFVVEQSVFQKSVFSWKVKVISFRIKFWFWFEENILMGTWQIFGISYLVFHHLIPLRSCMADSYPPGKWLEEKWKDKSWWELNSCSLAKIPNPPEASTQSNEQVFNYYNWKFVIPESNPEAFLGPQSASAVKKYRSLLCPFYDCFMMISICCIFFGEQIWTLLPCAIWINTTS